MSTQWIKLTGKDGAELFVNMDTVTMMRPRKNWTRIWFMGATDHHVDVFESAAEIVVSLDDRLARQMQPAPEPRMEPAQIPAQIPAEPLPQHSAPRPPRPSPIVRPDIGARPDLGALAPRPAGMTGVAAKLARAAAIKVSKPLAEMPPAAPPRAPSPEDYSAHPQMSETVAEQREQRARRRASAIMDARREELARKLEAMRREKGTE